MNAVPRTPLSGNCVWTGDDLKRDERWIVPWTGAEIAEIATATAAASRRGLGHDDVSADDFRAPLVAAKLRRVAADLEDGCGIVKLTGLPVGAYDEAGLKLLFLGLSRHLGTPVFQNERGQLIRWIVDEGGDVAKRHGAITAPTDGKPFLSSKARTYSNGALRFHTDRTDVVGLLSVGRARSGGVSRVASSVAVHNAMLARRPDLAEVLYAPIWRSRFGEEKGGETAIYPLPVFGVRDGKFTSHYSRTYVEAAQMLDGTPPMTDRQWEALDVLDALAAELSLEMRLGPGDMQFVNNHVIYHARTAFEDDPAAGLVRRLLRVWLCMPNHRALPRDQAVLWVDTEPGRLRGGIGQGAVA